MSCRRRSKVAFEFLLLAAALWNPLISLYTFYSQLWVVEEVANIDRSSDPASQVVCSLQKHERCMRAQTAHCSHATEARNCKSFERIPLLGSKAPFRMCSL